jgi:hypothetical protein
VRGCISSIYCCTRPWLIRILLIFFCIELLGLCLVLMLMLVMFVVAVVVVAVCFASCGLHWV